MTSKRRSTSLFLSGCVVFLLALQLLFSYRTGATSLLISKFLSEEGKAKTASAVEESTTSSPSTTSTTEETTTAAKRNWTTGGIVKEALNGEQSSVGAEATSRIRPAETKSSPIDDAYNTTTTSEIDSNKTFIDPEAGLFPVRGNATLLTCMLEQQKALAFLQSKWEKQQVPVLRSIVKTDNQTLRFSFTIIHLSKYAYPDWALDANWTCDGIKPVRTKDSYTKVRDSPSESVLVVECNIAAVNLSTTLATGGKVVSTTYFTKHFPCATQSDRVFPQRKQSPTSCTMISGNRRNLVQWIEYHRLIGFQRFVVYVNERWETKQPSEPLPQAADIAYIPWPATLNKSWKYPKAAQIGAMMDCIFRAQAQQIPWLAIHDVDEYIQVMPENETLRGILQQSEEDVELGGLHLPSWFFGSNRTETVATDHNDTLLIDYVYRDEECYGEGNKNNKQFGYRRGREKLILRPQNILHFALHYISEGGYMKEDERLRLNHYKITSDAYPFKIRKRLVRDDSFVNKYGPILRKRLRALREEAHIHIDDQKTREH